MTIEVELPDGSIVEFPDGTSPQTMEMALARYRQPQASTGSGAPRTAPNNSAFASLITGRQVDPEQARRMAMTPAQREAAAQQEAANYETAKSRTGALGQTINYFDALQHHGLSAAHGLAQLGVQGLEKVGLVPEGTSARDQAALAQNEANYQQRTAGGNFGTYLGAGIGEVAPWLVGVGEARAAGLLPTVTATGLKGAAIKGGLLAGEGALMGAATPVTEGDYAQQKTRQVITGLLAAPAAQALLHVPGLAARGVQAIAGPLLPSGREAAAGRLLGERFGTTPDVLTALDQPGPAGFVPSVAQALKTPEAIQAERGFRNSPATAAAFSRANAENNARLIAEAEKIAGTPQARKAAEDARAAATDPVFKQLKTGRVDPLPALKALDSLERSGLGQGDRVSAAIEKLRAKIQSKIENGTINADVLSGIRETASSYLGPMATKAEKKALAPVRDSIVDALDAAIPGYRDTVAAYGRLSQPLSDMAAGDALVKSMRKGGLDTLGGDAPSLNAVESLLLKDAKAKYPMSPAARQRVEAIRDALKQRSITSNTIAAQGNSATTAEGSQMLQALQGGAHEQALRSIPGVGPYLARVPGLLREDISRRAGLKVANAKETAAAIKATQRASRPQSLLPQYNLPAFLLPYVEQ